MQQWRSPRSSPCWRPIDARWQLSLGRRSIGRGRLRKVGNEMSRIRYWFSIACLLTLPAASLAHAQAGNYPEKTVTMISDAAAGSAPDVVARFVADGLGKIWGQQVIVINHPGANGSVGAHAASEAAA